MYKPGELVQQGDRQVRVPARVDGYLAISRSLGDREIKALHPGAVIAVPQITVTPLEASDVCIVLACDGIWDVLNNDDVGALVGPMRPDAAHVSALVVVEAQKKGSCDDLTAIVVDLQAH